MMPPSPAGGRPQPGPPRAYRFPRFQREQLANGLQVIMAPVSRLPLTTVQVLVDAGAATENPDEAGIAHLMSQALAEGTMRAGGTQLAEEFERLGGSLSVAAIWDGVHLTTSVPCGHFEAALGLMAEVTRTPAFPEREVERLRDERLAELLELRAEPRGLANERFTSVLYEAGSRYGLPEAGSEDTVRSLSRPHCMAYHESRFGPRATTVIVVGDVSSERALAAVRAAFEDWSGAEAVGPRPVARPAQQERTLHVISRPGAPQS
jgi:predicted Zn-dependent peptidase